MPGTFISCCELRGNEDSNCEVGPWVLGHLPRSGTDVPWRIPCSFVRILYTGFLSSCASFSSHQQYLKVPLSLDPHPYLYTIDFLILVILTRVRWNLQEPSISITLIKILNTLKTYFLATFIRTLKVSNNYLAYLDNIYQCTNSSQNHSLP